MDLSHHINKWSLTHSLSYLLPSIHTKGDKQLPFRIKSALLIIQCLMENLLWGLSWVSVCINHILITGHTELEGITYIGKLLERLSLAGMKLRWETCTYMVQYLVHKITKEGIEPTEEKKGCCCTVTPSNQCVRA